MGMKEKGRRLEEIGRKGNERSDRTRSAKH